MFRIIFLAILIAIMPVCETYSQDKKEFRKNFFEAEFFLINEFYEEAAFLYRQLLNSDPTNLNLHFLLGASYLSIDGLKTQAIPHLEKAVSGISAGYREGSFREKNAPRLALFALARAYHINNQFELAIEYYEKYKIVMKISDVAEVDFVNHHIASVKLAKEYIKNKKDIEYVIISESPFHINRAVLAEKDSLLIYVSEKPFFSAINSSRLKNGVWEEPIIINDQLKVDGKYNLSSISNDGKELYLSVWNDSNWDLCVSYNQDGEWTPIQLLKEINTKYNETHASITHDKRRLYFTSDRPGGLGAKDIYYSDRDQRGNWGNSINIGRPVNTKYSEETPFATADNKTLFFSSMGHPTLGGFDIFYSTMLPNGQWSYPENLGYPLNTCDDDLFFVPIGQGKQALYTSVSGLLPQGEILAINLNPEEESSLLALITNSKLEQTSTFTENETVEVTSLRQPAEMNENNGNDPKITILTKEAEHSKTSHIDAVAETLEMEPSVELASIPEEDSDTFIEIAHITPEEKTDEIIITPHSENYHLILADEGSQESNEVIYSMPSSAGETNKFEVVHSPYVHTMHKRVISSTILFRFDSFNLSDEAKSELDRLFNLMAENPTLTVEVTGYTDALGSFEYNFKLAQKRSDVVIDYLASRGIPGNSFTSKAVGKSNYIAKNTNEDGSDNPEGRRLNRRAEISLPNNIHLNFVPVPFHVPDHLKPSSPDYSFSDAFITHLNRYSVRNKKTVSKNEGNYYYTVQFIALLFPAPSNYFSNIGSYNIRHGEDNFYRYSTGTFRTRNEAEKHLQIIREKGYQDAFIRRYSIDE